MSRAALLLCYDIRDPKRLRRVHAHVRKHGIPLQYSVFYLEKSNAEVTLLLRELEGIIDTGVDDIRVYTISRYEDIETLGVSLAVEGIDLFSEGRKLVEARG